jgi:hypothetical protein
MPAHSTHSLCGRWLRLYMCGMTATHFACSNTSSGIPLSGIPIISCSTVVALSSRSRSIFPRRPCPAQRTQSKHRKHEHYVLHWKASFLLPVRQLPDSSCVNTRTQIRIDSWAHQDNLDLNKSGLRRSEQICSHGNGDRRFLK